MFSATEPISFVFANEHDVYYGPDLLKRNLNQQLWTMLHHTYKAVYFLTASEGTFEVRTFGDVAASPYQEEQVGMAAKLWKILMEETERDRFEKWILRQLCRPSGDGVAFVCSLEDFCQVMSQEEWQPALEQIGKETRRTGIFVLTAPATVERSRELLLHSPVFEWLGAKEVTDLRSGGLRELYGSIKHRKWDTCLFLNAFTSEQMRSMLIHILMEHPERCMDLQTLTELSEYLTAYLCDPSAQREMPLAELGVPMSYLSYRELYELLQTESVWNRLMEQQNSCQLRPVKNTCMDAPILWDRNSYAGHCMMIKLPHWISQNHQARDQAMQTLKRIWREISVPKNRMENPQLAEAVDGFITQLDTVSYNDLDTYQQILSALEFCVRWVYTQPEDPKMKRIGEILEKFHSSIHLSQQCFHMSQNLELFRRQAAPGILQKKRMEQVSQQLQILTDFRHQYVDLVRASVLELTMPASSHSIMEDLSQLEQQIEHYKQEADQTAKLEPEPQEEPQENVLPQELQEPDTADDDYNFVFRPEDLFYTTPQ